MKLDIETFSSVLIANRGEIACRIIKTAKKCRIRTVAVYSQVDKDLPHVKLADQSIHIGDGPAESSYLSITKIIEAALQLDVDAIHPGYGFLSENADFARACKKNGIIFIGPDSKAIKIMGNKEKAKKIVSAAGIKCIPGCKVSSNIPNEILSQAKEIGYPLMIKPSAGGGGKGMRLINHEKELQAAVEISKSEALRSFGSSEIIFESAIGDARHVEIQVFADCHGNMIHLGERDCSIQRRHQKVFEEAPCPTVDDKLRESMGEIAIKIAREINYVGAGTIEFLLAEDEKFYFLEMNTRLQVEHPVTELITSLDLVYLQFLVADGKSLPFTQGEIKLQGHAIETRLYAENPSNNFLPSSGTLKIWDVMESKGVRVDNGYNVGNSITPFYDPMLAKIIGFGSSRKEAIENLIHTLERTSILGVENNRSFLIDVLHQQKFVEGCTKTSFLDEVYQNGYEMQPPSSTEYALVGALIYKTKLAKYSQKIRPSQKELIGWSNSKHINSKFLVQHLDEKSELYVKFLDENKFLVSWHNENIEVSLENDEIRVSGNLIFPILFNIIGKTYQIIAGRKDYCFEEITQASDTVSVETTGKIKAPMHGVIIDIFVSIGNKVKIGDCIMILEAMKMQHELISSSDGTVTEIFTKVGQQVSANEFLAEIRPRN